MIEQLLTDCIAACKKALKTDGLSAACKASLQVCVTACEAAQADPGALIVCCEECFEAANYLASYRDEASKAAEVSCTACGVGCRQVMYRSEKHRMCRYIRIEPGKIDRDKKTVPISFSSEYPAMQRCDGGVSPEIAKDAGLKAGQAYVEILDHDPANVDLSLLKNRGAFLDEHDEKDQLGVVEDAEIVDKIGRAIIRLGSDEKAIKRFNQMADDVRPHISAGYKYTRFIGTEKLPNGRTAYRFAWKGLEISSVAAPNDPTVGVARSYQDLPIVDSEKQTNADLTAEKKNDMKILLDPNPAAGGGGTVTVDENKIRTEAVAGYKTRAKEITAIADAMIGDYGSRDGGKMADKIRSMANEALCGDETVQAFKVRCMEGVLKAKPAKPVGLEEVTDADGARTYSIQRGIQSAFRNREKGGAGIPDGLEGEVHQEIVRRANADFGGLGYEAQGFQVPHNATLGGSRISRSDRRRMTRDSQATIFGSGGAFVPTELRIPVIELLRNRMVLESSGLVRTISGLQGNLVIPRQEAAATAYSVSEIAALTASQQILGQIALSPKRVGSTQTYSKQLVMQSTPDAEAFIRDDHFKVIALQWDRLGLVGQGAASEPLGIFNTPGVQSIVFGATPTYIKIVSMETAIRNANVQDPLVYMSTPSTKGSLKTAAEALTGATTIGGSQNAIWKPDNTVNGYPALDSNQIPGNVVMVGAQGQAIQAMWGGLDIVVDIYTKAGNAEVVVTFNTWGDFACRHPQAFCVSADAGNQ